MQIIVGVLLFTPLLFLLPTTAVYYALALLLHTAVLAACWGLEILVQLTHSIPVFTIWCWAMKPGVLPGELTSWYMLCGRCFDYSKAQGLLQHHTQDGSFIWLQAR